jgi:hypothetical protein
MPAATTQTDPIAPGRRCQRRAMDPWPVSLDVMEASNKTTDALTSLHRRRFPRFVCSFLRRK